MKIQYYNFVLISENLYFIIKLNLRYATLNKYLNYSWWFVVISVHFQNVMIFFQNIHIFQFYFLIWTVIFKFLEVLQIYSLFFIIIDIILFLNILKFLVRINRKGYLLIVIYQLFCLTWYIHHLFHLFHLKYRNLLTKRDSNLPTKIYLNFIFIDCNF